MLAGPSVSDPGVGDGRRRRDRFGAGVPHEAKGNRSSIGPKDPKGFRGPLVFDRLVRAVAAALAVTMFLGAIAYNPHGEEGAWSIWNLRARFLFRAGAFWRDAFSSDLGWSHPDYPLLLPGLVALCWKLTGQESTDAPIAIAFLFALGTTGVVVEHAGSLTWQDTRVACRDAVAGNRKLRGIERGALWRRAVELLYPGDSRAALPPGSASGRSALQRAGGIDGRIRRLDQKRRDDLRGGRDCGSRIRAVQVSASAPRLFRSYVRLLAGLVAPLAVVIFFKLRVSGPSDLLAIAGLDDHEAPGRSSAAGS